MKNALVTGGAGFIGGNFIQYCLNAQDHGSIEKLLNLDKLTYAGNPASLSAIEDDPRYTFVEGDIGDQAMVSELLKTHKPQVIINFAAESHVDRSIDSPEPFFETNVLGTLRLLDAVKCYWSELSRPEQKEFRFLHVSTDEVYGSLAIDDPAFKESNAYEPNSPYAASKASSDHIVRAYHHTYGLPVLTTNCSNNYGPYQFPEKLIPLMILNALSEQKLPIYGDGMNIRDWLYVEDHCEAIIQVVEKGRLGETYNIGGNCEKPNIEIIDTLCLILDRLRPRTNGESYSELKHFVTDRPGHDRRYAIDSSKIEQELGWKPNVSFSSGLEKTIHWYLENRQWCDDITNNTYQRERLGGK